MTLVAEIFGVWIPILASIVFVAAYAIRRLREGLTPLQVVFDRAFMLVFFYTGALLAIYLSTFRFFYLFAWPPRG